MDLRSRGFSIISNLSRYGYPYTATADWRGQQVDRAVGRIGFILEQRPLTPNQVQGLQDDWRVRRKRILPAPSCAHNMMLLTIERLDA